MKITIDNSLEWSQKRSILAKNISQIPPSRNKIELNRLMNNLDRMVTELSSAEVDARRGNKTRANELLVKINESIEMVEEYTLIGRLIACPPTRY